MFFIFLQVNSQRRTQWVFECSRAFIFGWSSGTDRNQSLETVASEKHYLIHRWVLFFIFSAKIEKIREIEVPNEFLNVRAHLYLAWGPDQTGTKLGNKFYLSLMRKPKREIQTKSFSRSTISLGVKNYRIPGLFWSKIFVIKSQKFLGIKKVNKCNEYC